MKLDKSTAKMVQLEDSKGINVLFRLFKDPDVGFNNEDLSERLIESNQDEDIDTDNEILECGIQTSIDDVRSLHYFLRNKEYIKELRNWRKIKDVHLNECLNQVRLGGI